MLPLLPVSQWLGEEMVFNLKIGCVCFVCCQTSILCSPQQGSVPPVGCVCRIPVKADGCAGGEAGEGSVGRCRGQRGCQVSVCCCVYNTIRVQHSLCLPGGPAARLCLSCPGSSCGREWRGRSWIPLGAQKKAGLGAVSGYPFVASSLTPALLSKICPYFLVLLSCLITFLSLVS